MTAAQNFKIAELLEQAVGRDKARQFTEQIEQVIDDQIHTELKIVATKEDLQKGLERLENRIWITFVTVVLLLIGLYFKK